MCVTPSPSPSPNPSLKAPQHIIDYRMLPPFPYYIPFLPPEHTLSHEFLSLASVGMSLITSTNHSPVLNPIKSAWPASLATNATQLWEMSCTDITCIQLAVHVLGLSCRTWIVYCQPTLRASFISPQLCSTGILSVGIGYQCVQTTYGRTNFTKPSYLEFCSPLSTFIYTCVADASTPMQRGRRPIGSNEILM